MSSSWFPLRCADSVGAGFPLRRADNVGACTSRSSPCIFSSLSPSVSLAPSRFICMSVLLLSFYVLPIRPVCLWTDIHFCVCLDIHFNGRAANAWINRSRSRGSTQTPSPTHDTSGQGTFIHSFLYSPSGAGRISHYGKRDVIWGRRGWVPLPLEGPCGWPWHHRCNGSFSAHRLTFSVTPASCISC